MGKRVTGLSFFALIILESLSIEDAVAQRTRPKAAAPRKEIQTATTVRTEMIAGILSPALNHVGDEISLRLNEDIKSNGRSVVKKGTVLKGIIRNAVNVGSANSSTGKPRSMIEIEWSPPATLVTGTGQLLIAMQSFTYVSPLVQTERVDPEPGHRVASPAKAASAMSFLPKASGKTNAALMSMPSIVAVDQQTAAMLGSDFGLSQEQQIYKTGRGDLINSSRKRQSVDLFSRMNNDTIITSLDTGFEIGPGAQMQMLVGVERR